MEKRILELMLKRASVRRMIALIVNEATYEEKEKCRPYFLETPEMAYEWAFYVDRKPMDDTREVAIRSPIWAFRYAAHIDQKPRVDTLKAVEYDSLGRRLYFMALKEHEDFNNVLAKVRGRR